MSTATTTRHFPGSTTAAAIACAVVLAGGAALGIALTNTHSGSAEPVAPTAHCTSALCGVEHPILPGRHDFQQSSPGHFHYTSSGGRVMLGQ